MERRVFIKLGGLSVLTLSCSTGDDSGADPAKKDGADDDLLTFLNGRWTVIDVTAGTTPLGDMAEEVQLSTDPALVDEPTRFELGYWYMLDGREPAEDPSVLDEMQVIMDRDPPRWATAELRRGEVTPAELADTEGGPGGSTVLEVADGEVSTDLESGPDSDYDYVTRMAGSDTVGFELQDRSEATLTVRHFNYYTDPDATEPETHNMRYSIAESPTSVYLAQLEDISSNDPSGNPTTLSSVVTGCSGVLCRGWQLCDRHGPHTACQR